MKTSSNDTVLIERYLDQQLSETEKQAFMNRLVTDNAFSQTVAAQTQVRRLVRSHHLLRQRERVKAWHQRLHNDPARRSMRQAIEALFKF
jgi:hypothetical protein